MFAGTSRVVSLVTAYDETTGVSVTRWRSDHELVVGFPLPSGARVNVVVIRTVAVMTPVDDCDAPSNSLTTDADSTTSPPSRTDAAMSAAELDASDAVVAAAVPLRRPRLAVADVVASP